MTHTRRPIALATLALAAAVSCRGPAVPVGIEGARTAAGSGGISVTAVLPEDPALIEGLFRAYPPDSGVVPVYLSVTNNDTSAVVLHSLGNLPLGDPFRSITLDAGSGPIDPIHPLEVAMRIMGRAEAPDYKKMGAWHVIGGIVIPPLGIYYIFRWGGYALDYRPLLRNSFFPAGRGGSFEPVPIGPGQTASGFLYFPLGPPGMPYYTDYEPGAKKRSKPVPVRKVRAQSGLELTVRPAATGPGPAPAAPEFEAYGIRRLRAEDEGHGETAPGAGQWDLVLLGRGRDTGGKLDLMIGSGRGLAGSRSMDAFVRVQRINNESGELVDASTGGGFAVCAVNFKRKSRLYSIDLRGAEPALAADLRLERGILRVFALPAGACVITDDGFCGVYRYEDLKRTSYGRLGTNVSDASYAGGRILTFGGGTIDEFHWADGRWRGPQRSGPAPARGIRQGVRAGSSSLVVHRGKGALGDTLVLYDLGELRERTRLSLPGRVEATAASGTVIAVQVEGGVLMRFETGGPDAPAPIDAGWLPERAGALLTIGDAGIMVSRERRLMIFDLDSIGPSPPAGPAGGAVLVPVRTGKPGGDGG